MSNFAGRFGTERRRLGQFQQFEVWNMKDGKWEFIASFQDFDTAYAVTRNRSNQVRLLKVTYKDGLPAEQEIIAELGQIRGEP